MIGPVRQIAAPTETSSRTGKRESSTGGGLGRQERQPQQHSDQSRTLPQPSEPKWKHLSEDLKLESFWHLATYEIASLHQASNQHQHFIDSNEVAVAELIKSKETARIKWSYDFKGRGFIQCLQWWACRKGIAANLPWLSVVGATFVKHYMAANGDADGPIKINLCLLTNKLLCLYVFNHTPQEVWDNFPFESSGFKPEDFCRDEEALVRETKRVGLFPEYARIPPADNHVEMVRSDPQFFGSVVARLAQIPSGRFRLSTLGEDTHNEIPKNTDIRKYWQAGNDDLIQDFLYDGLKLDRLPVGLGYFVGSSENWELIDRMAEIHHGDKKALRPFVKAALLEKIQAG